MSVGQGALENVWLGLTVKVFFTSILRNVLCRSESSGSISVLRLSVWAVHKSVLKKWADDILLHELFDADVIG